MVTLPALVLLFVAVGPSVAAELVPQCKPVTAACLSSLSMEPWGPEMEVGDPRYLEIVSRGLGAMPELIALLEDDTPTSQLVPLFGGTWAVGDIAMSAISDTVRGIPWTMFVPEEARQVSEWCGFCAYWNYVRACKQNRVSLMERFAEWYSQHAVELVWEANPRLLTKGRYVLNAPMSKR